MYIYMYCICASSQCLDHVISARIDFQNELISCAISFLLVSSIFYYPSSDIRVHSVCNLTIAQQRKMVGIVRETQKESRRDVFKSKSQNRFAIPAVASYLPSKSYHFHRVAKSEECFFQSHTTSKRQSRISTCTNTPPELACPSRAAGTLLTGTSSYQLLCPSSLFSVVKSTGVT